ncbi:MAG: hypothetical protein Q8K75_12410 [Chlamydiales bacterium]|nr:hypothetical protein [Chlamydiales bacterium]
METGSVEQAAHQVLKSEYTDLAEIEKVLANLINGDVFVTDDLNDDLFREVVRSYFVIKYLQSQFDPESIKARIYAFASYPRKTIQSFHRFLAHHIFCPKNIARMNEEAAAYVANLTPFSWADLAHYSEWGGVRLLRNQNGEELVDAMRREGVSDREILSVIQFAINANSQIKQWIYLTYTLCDKDTLATIREEFYRQIVRYGSQLLKTKNYATSLKRAFGLVPVGAICAVSRRIVMSFTLEYQG